MEITGRRRQWPDIYSTFCASELLSSHCINDSSCEAPWGCWTRCWIFSLQAWTLLLPKMLLLKENTDIMDVPDIFRRVKDFHLKRKEDFFYFRSTDSKLIFLSFSLVLRLQLKTSVSYLRSVTESVKRIVPRLSSSYLQQTTFNLHFSFYLTPILLSLPPLSHPIPCPCQTESVFFLTLLPYIF